ncbi:hypothetical protein OKW50_001861 [Paraburkholderia youngii]|uniref:Uncharacterized protein n=1 Tax=Paraburkholderia youngii TaxID=2782701 RepID=A0A7W8L2B8_9BURK|nr:hypothetical protein [Paraburkholderia youngii]MBB5399080.1 hypothetical protein [Paraburkholderia youngii]NUX56155.1 hypothetical protein [Paraburkholderia youngii]NVI08375.1 hypothetical protein [Paraburkholderia youngii]
MPFSLIKSAAIPIAFVLVLSAPAYAGSPLGYIGDATNAIYALDENSSPEEVAKAYAQGCNALKRLSSDESFRKALYAKSKKSGGGEQREALQAARSFAGSFVDAEATALKQIGVSNEAAGQILDRAKDFRNDITEKPDPKLIERDISQTRDVVCKASGEASSSLRDTKTRNRWGLIALGFGGLALIAADAGSEVPSGGFSTASFGLGVGMVGTFLSKTMKEW